MPPKKDDKAKKDGDKKGEKGKSKEPKKESTKGSSSAKTLEKSEIPGSNPSKPDLLPGDKPQPLCLTHGKNLVLYCTSCEDPICEDCAMTGPHNNQVTAVVTSFIE